MRHRLTAPTLPRRDESMISDQDAETQAIAEPWNVKPSEDPKVLSQPCVAVSNVPKRRTVGVAQLRFCSFIDYSWWEVNAAALTAARCARGARRSATGDRRAVRALLGAP